ncbi:TolC family protein [Agrobacterium sp. CCNWLW71]|uniref:TolC family protein n=1 Tax=unclassified Agrobacterium TaxID=2632611 RepID=UPI002FF1DC55
MQAAVDVTKAQRDQAYFTYQSTVLSAMEDVQNAIVAVNQSRIRQSKLAVSVQRYRHTLQISTELNRTGDNDLFSLLDTERSLYSVEEDLIETRSDVATYYIALNKALGGGWGGEIDSSKQKITDVREGPRLASTR